MDIPAPLQENVADAYAALLHFTREKTCTYAELDEATVLGRVRLFALPNDKQLDTLEVVLNKIIKALPAIKRIFSKPIIRLKDVQAILPVEAVRVINIASVAHVSQHSELWGNIEGNELKPRKLMTLDRMEEYVIYENVAFARLIDLLFSFISKQLRLLKDVLYAQRDFSFNLLDRTQHLQYFLALGKLHVGYAVAQNTNGAGYERCLEKLLFIHKTLREKRNSSVYQQCKSKAGALKLKRTNIFRSHKDYRQVYSLLKYFLGGENAPLETPLFTSVDPEAYAAYCNLLSVFALSHFNFSFAKKTAMDFTHLNVKCTQGGWQVRLQSIFHENISGLKFTVKKEKEYRICVLFASEDLRSEKFSAFKKEHEAEEYLLASPWAEKDGLCLSVSDVHSFQRIQQLILRGMIYADKKKEVCPFCLQPLIQTELGYECKTCRTHISSRICPQTDKPYFLSGILYLNTKRLNAPQKQHKYLLDTDTQSQFLYRNISPIDVDGNPLCPYCKKEH